MRELLLAKETEKRIKYEYNRIIEELKKNELTLEKAIKQQNENEIKKDADFKMRIQSDEEYVNYLQDLIKNHVDLKNKALDKISITEKKFKKIFAQLEGKNITIRK
jgi:flagellar biosynthesis/type III secretory pathway M-ring protein FliF/YscJ